MKESIITKQDIKESYDKLLPIHAKQQIKILPEWSDFINNMNNSIQKETLVLNTDTPKYKTIGHLRVFDTLAFSIDHPPEYPYPGIESMIDYLDKLDLKPFTAITFINLAGGQNTTSKHSDNCSILYVQAINSARWIVYMDGEEKEFILEPGDVMFIPQGLMHEVFAFMPRAAISFAVRPK
jgi:hypothetical protein